ncbi:zinc ribbon domain-containing protein [Sporosalibacterium faouarense]|uniref:zinc ribbon domain-containing protein n=1 Tax=Sporosalibacterium faouarense TaxID=516123 RepID=UPI00141D60A7|nr:zinc ribbon domain-containing protein [Sporosalibacterium faouarense]MTI46292.1 transcriptional regulator [Bacillota bacterium]
MDYDTKYCQSCGMPIEGKEILGTNKDGSKNKDYCMYCYENGGFKADMTMDEMIKDCIPHMIKANPKISKEEARESMRKFFPTLKRWQ